VKNFLRASAALAVTALLIAFLGAPVCFSSACPMSGAERAACKAMGRECCGTTGGQVSHAPVAPALVLARGLLESGERRLRALVEGLDADGLSQAVWGQVDTNGDWRRDVNLPEDLGERTR